MLDSTIELISLAASNSLAAFCFCNMIIAILLVGSLKPNNQSSEQIPDDSPTVVHYHNFKKNGVSFSVKDDEENVLSVSLTTGEDEEESQAEEIESEDEDKEGDDDVLKRRVEEFIEKINKEWRAEKLKTYAL